MKLEHSKALQQKSHQLIPGGAHTYAKGDDQYPVNAPGFILRGNGCHIWDVDNNEFIEYGMGLRSVALGHGFRPVVEAAYQAMQQGINFVRPHPLEVALAEKMLALLPAGEMVKFAKNGSDVTTAALKLARAHTKRDLIAICADHPFFSVDDWFIGSTAMAAGIPQAVRPMTLKFRYNDLASIQSLFAQYPGQIAAVMMEAETSESPYPDYLHQVQALCRQEGALFILDEIITGFRWHLQGAQAVHQLEPDLSTFGKAMANGFSLAALVGKRDVMRLGGLDHDQERVFLLSTTYGAETHALAAALATIQIYENEDVIEHLYAAGDRLRAGVGRSVAKYQLEEYFGVVGRSCNLIFVTKDQQKQRSQPFRTLFMQEIVKHGILAPSFVVSYAHSDADIDTTIAAVDEALVVYRNALEEGVEKYLQGPSVKPVMRKYN